MTLKPVPFDVASPALINSSISPSWSPVLALILIIAPVVKLVELISTKASESVIVLFVTDNEAALSASVTVTEPSVKVKSALKFKSPSVIPARVCVKLPVLPAFSSVAIVENINLLVLLSQPINASFPSVPLSITIPESLSIAFPNAPVFNPIKVSFITVLVEFTVVVVPVIVKSASIVTLPSESIIKGGVVSFKLSPSKSSFVIIKLPFVLSIPIWKDDALAPVVVNDNTGSFEEVSVPLLAIVKSVTIESEMTLSVITVSGIFNIIYKHFFFK